MIRYIATDTIVLVSPIAASKGISFIRSPMDRLTAPPVAWKKEPWGRESRTVAPAWIIAAAASAETPFARSVGAKVCAATVAPAVVEAVAAAMRIPARGARTKAGMFIASRMFVTSY